MDHENTLMLHSTSPRSVYLPPISSSTGRWRYRWDLLDNKFVEKNETRRHCGMYFIAKILKSDIASKKAEFLDRPTTSRTGKKNPKTILIFFQVQEHVLVK